MNAEKSIMLHAFSDLRRVSSFDFLYHLKQYFSYVRTEKGKVNYHQFCHDIIEVLRDACPTFIIACLNDLVHIFAPSGEHPTQLFLMILCGFVQLNPARFSEDYVARWLAAHIFSKLILSGSLSKNKDVIINLARIYEFKMEELKELRVVIANRENFQVLKTLLLKLIRSHYFCTPASVIKRLGGPWEEFLDPLLDADQQHLAEKWATSHHTENHVISLLVRCYRRRKLFKLGLNLVTKYNLSSEFPDILYEYKENQMTKLVEKGSWVEARFMATRSSILHPGIDDGNDNDGMRLFQRLQELALQLKNSNLDQLCLVERETGFLKLQDIGISEDEVIMIDTVEGLAQALVHFSKNEVDVIGIDSEWRDCEGNVSILQIATAKKVFIFDMENLYIAEPVELDKCLRVVFHSTSILKLGYALHHDLRHLSKSFRNLQCFHYCEAPILDLQEAFPSVQGGLSGLAQTALGSALNKSFRLSDWRERPLSNSQVQYAALDAAVLIAIYKKECREPSLTSSAESKEEPSPSSSVGSKGKQIETVDWKSRIRSCKINLREWNQNARLNNHSMERVRSR